MNVSKLASAVYNNVVSGLSGYNATLNISIEQLEDAVVAERLQVIQEYSKRNLIPVKDLTYAINCIKLDCKSLDKCCSGDYSQSEQHFQIPQIINDFGDEGIVYIGTVDKQIPFKVYTNKNFRFHKFRMRRSKSPYVYIDTTPNADNLYDGWVFNAPMLEIISVEAIFKDPRQVAEWGCCDLADSENFSAINNEVERRLTQKYLSYYKQYWQPPMPNNQVPK